MPVLLCGNGPKEMVFNPELRVLLCPPSILMKALLFTLSLLLTVSLQAQSSTGQTTGQNNTGQNTNGQNGQNTQQDTVTQDGLWQGKFTGGNYIVRCNSIIALSKHEYISDGVARVVEVNLTLNSAQIVRFYFLEPYKPDSGSSTLGVGTQALDRAKGMFEQAVGRVSPDLATPKVVKNYPASTHAHTVEFVLKVEARITALYGSLERSFRTGQGRSWTE